MTPAEFAVKQALAAKSGPGSGGVSPALLEQRLNGKQDKLSGKPGQLVGFDEAGQAVAVDAPGGGEIPEIATDAEVAEMLDEVFSGET